VRKAIFSLAMAVPLAVATPLAADADSSVNELFDPAFTARSICTGGAGALHQAYDPSAQHGPQLAMSRLAFWRKEGDAVLMDNLGTYSHQVSTTSSFAQQFFDQGLRLTYGFNHGEAIRAFRKAQRLDPNCAMCYWGEALALGPNINAGMFPGDNEAALAALAKAKKAAPSASASEQALINALAKRYSADSSADRKALDVAYAEAMGEVSHQYPDDLDIATLYAEAVMDVQPWDYWLPGGKKTKGTSGEALSAIERVLAKNPEHPGAIHYYIHLVEASANPERAVPYAERLAALMPGEGHIVHMPSHIWYRIGRYKDSLNANIEAVRADEAYFKLAKPSQLYHAGYYTHNIHFVVVSAQMQGDAKNALEFGEKLSKSFSADDLALSPLVMPIRAASYFALADFAAPEAVLAEAEPDQRYPYLVAMWHYARGAVFAREGRRSDAMVEALAIEGLGRKVKFDALLEAGIPAPDLFAIAADTLKARVARQAGDVKTALALFAKAADTQEGLAYMEPPYWYFPVRRSLAAALLAAGRTDDAIQSFRKVLIEAPNDAYALYGLARAYEKDGDRVAARKTDALFAKAWAGGEARPDLLQY
jgi:tetratricopeptide (TPR) repeat protein